MKILRVYTDPEGETHFEDVELRLEATGADPLTTPIAGLPTTGAYFRHYPAGWWADWHPAPRRQLIVPVSGQVEVQVSDGQVRRSGPGTLTFVEDVSGKGHVTRSVDGPHLSLFIPVAEGWHLPR